jgi:hypothetical protein
VAAGFRHERVRRAPRRQFNGSPAQTCDTPRMQPSPAIYAWFLHREMLDALFDDTARHSVARAVRRTRTHGDQIAYARELERWLHRHEVPALHAALVTDEAHSGQMVWTELPFHWSDVARERGLATAGEGPRSTFHAQLRVDEQREVEVHGSFDPARLTCSTANSELRGVRSQYILGQVAHVSHDVLELRPVAIATRLLTTNEEWPEVEDPQRVSPSRVAQFSRAEWFGTSHSALDQLRAIPEAQVKRALASIIGEPVVPKDWGGEQSDLWTTRLRIEGRDYSAAFLLKGPAVFRPMTIGMLGKNGDQLERLSRTAADVLVVQHCHEIRPEVVSMLRSFASDFRHIRRYMVLDGFDTHAILSAYGHLPPSQTVSKKLAPRLE